MNQVICGFGLWLGWLGLARAIVRMARAMVRCLGLGLWLGWLGLARAMVRVAGAS